MCAKVMGEVGDNWDYLKLVILIKMPMISMLALFSSIIYLFFNYLLRGKLAGISGLVN
jgi:hypothetical protein